MSGDYNDHERCDAGHSIVARLLSIKYASAGHPYSLAGTC